MTPELFAKFQRDYLILTEKQSAVLLAAQFEELKRDITEFLLSDLSGQLSIEKLYERNFLERILDNLSGKIDNLSSSASSIVERAQKRIVNFTGNSLRRFLSELSSSIFEPDKEAVQKLIGRTQTGEPLKKLFASMKPAIAEKTKETLIEGFALGNKWAIAYAAQISEVERLRLQTTFADAIRGLLLHDTKVFTENAKLLGYIKAVS